MDVCNLSHLPEMSSVITAFWNVAEKATVFISVLNATLIWVEKGLGGKRHA